MQYVLSRRRGGTSDIWLLDADSERQIQLTFDPVRRLELRTYFVRFLIRIASRSNVPRDIASCVPSGE